MQRGKNFKFGIPHSSVDFVCAVLGAGASTAPTIPLDGTLEPTTSTYPKRCNSVDKTTAGAPTWVSTGLYTVTYAHSMPAAMFATGVVVAAGASPTAALEAAVTKISTSTRVLTVKIYTPSGTLTDLGTSDMLLLTVTGQDSGA